MKYSITWGLSFFIKEASKDVTNSLKCKYDYFLSHVNSICHSDVKAMGNLTLSKAIYRGWVWLTLLFQYYRLSTTVNYEVLSNCLLGKEPHF